MILKHYPAKEVKEIILSEYKKMMCISCSNNRIIKHIYEGSLLTEIKIDIWLRL
jgi:hypothetical protein